jgi:predicted acylesterase/phospholipase RssA
MVQMSALKIGVVLSSGGGRGVFGHTGFMSALEKLGIPISASSGCSAGAIVGGVLASGSPIEEWKSAVTRVRTRQYWTPRSAWKLYYSLTVQKGRGLKGLSDTAAAVGFLQENLRVDRFEECLYPFSAVAVNLGTSEKATFREGPLALGMMASAAMAAFFDPVEIDGQFFSDGAVIELAPADAICCQHGLDVLIVHHVAQRDYKSEQLEQAFNEPWTVVSILHRLIYRQRPWYTTGQPRSILACPCGCKAVIVILEPTLPELVWPLVRGGEDILRAAEAQALEQIQAIREPLFSEPRKLLE